MIIYMATNRLNGKMYIGQTVGSLGKRKTAHNTVSKYSRDNSYFHKAIRKYGKEEFRWTIIHDGIITIEFLNRLEIFYIGYYDTFNNGYNLTEGGKNALISEEMKSKIGLRSRGRKVSVETRRRMSEARKGKHLSEEVKRKISKSNKGQKRSEETKRKLSEAAFNRDPVSDETRQRMSKSQEGRKHSEKTKRKMSKVQSGENNAMYGRHHTEASKRGISKTQTIDLTDQKFGKLLVKKQEGRSNWGGIKWECKCDCGNTTVVEGGSLRRGHTKSCGCGMKKTQFKTAVHREVMP